MENIYQKFFSPGRAEGSFSSYNAPLKTLDRNIINSMNDYNKVKVFLFSYTNEILIIILIIAKTI